MSRCTGVLVALLAAAAPAAALTVARGGATALTIVIADAASPAERTAAEELRHYLERSTGARFPVVDEARHRAGGAAIWVGPTRAATRLGLEPSRMDPEDWRIRAERGHLVLVGGRPRGTLYAVFRFLEDHVGVRWWTPYDETVPRHDDLTLEPIDAAGRPAFAYRDFHGLRGPRKFQARMRANGHYSFLPAALGGHEGYGPPNPVHDFYHYAPPQELFATHPEFYSEIRGRRTADRAQLCLTNPALAAFVAQRLRGYIEQARRQARERGETPPRLFDISQNDWGRACRCEPCTRLRRTEGSHAAALVQFLNRVADGIAADYPDVLIDTLAYRHTLEPPRSLAYRDNVVVRFAALAERDFLRSLEHRRHRRLRRQLEGWRGRTAHLRIWTYAVSFGFEPNNLPLPNLEPLARDFRYYRKLGVEGLFVQCDHPIVADLRDLKVWVLLRLAEDPSRELSSLVVEFTDGFYGAAGPILREYREGLRRAARGHSLRYPMHHEDYDYLDPRFLRWAQERFDQAMRRVRGEAVLEQRVRHARLPLDRATLWRWTPVLARRSPHGPALDPDPILARLRRTAFEQIDLRIPESRREDQRQWVEGEIGRLRERIRPR